MKDKYILIHQNSLYRAESRWQKPYSYRKVAEKHAKRLQDRCIRNGGAGNDPVIVVSTSEYAEMIKGKGEWKQPILGEKGKLVWVPFDTPACCDPSTETYACM